MFETFTNRASPTAASHAANTRITMGVGNEIIELEFKVEVDVMMNSESIIPSRHRRVDIRWDRNIRVPKNESKKARVRLR